MRFSKWHGLGNDYLLVQRAEVGTPLTEEQVRRLCDYHFGVGSDGVLEVVAANGNEAEVVIWNPDESRVIRDEDMFSRAGHSIYAGREVTGWPVTTRRSRRISSRSRAWA